MIRLLALTLVAVGALAGTAAGARNPGAVRITGPATLKGPGIVVGMLKSSAASARVTFTTGGARGGVAFVDRGGDLELDCKAPGGATTKTLKNGRTALVCKGDATATGSAFAFAARGPKFELTVPTGYSGRARHALPRHRGAGKREQGSDQQSAAPSSSNANDESVAAAEQALADAIASGNA
jgi:hypothetical protein